MFILAVLAIIEYKFYYVVQFLKWIIKQFKYLPIILFIGVFLISNIRHYLATKILYNNLSPIEYYNGQDIKELIIENQDWNFLTRLKK
jgi:hypothetical protein